MPQKLKPRSYNTSYTILFLTDNGEILHEAAVNADSRGDAKIWAMTYAEDAHIQYDRISVRKSAYRGSAKKYLIERESIDPLDAERVKISINITRRQQMKMVQIYSLTGLNIHHYSTLVKNEIDRIYDIYFNADGSPKK